MVREHCDLYAIEAKRARECDAIVRLASDHLCLRVLRWIPACWGAEQGSSSMQLRKQLTNAPSSRSMRLKSLRVFINQDNWEPIWNGISMMSALLQVLWMSRLILVSGNYSSFALSWTEQKQNSVPSFFREVTLLMVRDAFHFGRRQRACSLSAKQVLCMRTRAADSHTLKTRRL